MKNRTFLFLFKLFAVLVGVVYVVALGAQISRDTVRRAELQRECWGRGGDLRTDALGVYFCKVPR